jgi:hypothetical protein
MTKRFFKAQIGDAIYFRASDTRVYASASIGRYGLGFSAKPAGPGASPAIEITKKEYDALVARKTARLKADPKWRGFTKPDDSWVEA